MRKFKGICFSLLLNLLAIQLMACVYPVSLEKRVDNADQIAIGTIIQQQAYWDIDTSNIYTVYTVQTEAYLKGRSPYYYFDIILPGGIIEQDAQIMTPDASLRLNASYVFLLENIPTDKQVVLNTPNNFSNPVYRPYAYVQGSLEQINGFYKDYFGAKPISPATILAYIKNRTGFVPTRPDGRQLMGLSNPNPTITPSGFSRRKAISFKDGLGNAATTFHAGRIEDANDLIIEGSGFGTTPGTVKFTRSDDGGQSLINAYVEETDLISWTDTAIRLKIPQTAGTGVVEVYDNENTLVGSQEIFIEWSIKPIFSNYKNFVVDTRQFINFIDRNDLGGYTLTYNSTSGMSTNFAAKTAFERAVAKWHCATGVHWTVDSQSTREEVDADDISVIIFQEDMPVGVVAMTSSRYKASGSTKCDLEKTTWYLREFDMQFAHPDNMIDGLSWNYTDNPPAFNEFDFETIALHELGHAHGLGHINKPNSTMYFSIENGLNKRTLQKEEIAGGLYQMEQSLDDNCISSKQPMHRHDDFCGIQSAAFVQTSIKVYIEGYYEPANNLMRTALTEKELLPLAQPFNRTPFNYLGTEQITTLDPDIVDWLLLGIRDAVDYQQVLCNKAVLLKSDGTVVDVTGNTIITFDCVPPENYHLSVTHHNHLSIVTNGPIAMTADGTTYDFTTSSAAALGDNQLKVVEDVFVMHSGDFDCNGVINNEDYNIWKLNGAVLNIYSPADADGNGIINSLDYNLWKLNRSKIGMLEQH